MEKVLPSVMSGNEVPSSRLILWGLCPQLVTGLGDGHWSSYSINGWIIPWWINPCAEWTVRRWGRVRGTGSLGTYPWKLYLIPRHFSRSMLPCSFAHSVLLWGSASLCTGPAAMEPYGRGLTTPILWTKTNPLSWKLSSQRSCHRNKEQTHLQVIYNKANECMRRALCPWKQMGFIMKCQSLANPWRVHCIPFPSMPMGIFKAECSCGPSHTVIGRN